MAYSSVTYTGTGITGPYAIPFPYIDRSHVKVYLDGVATTAFTWLTSSSIQFSSAVTAGVSIVIQRETPRDSRLVDYADATILLAADLDRSDDQNFFIAQELIDAGLLGATDGTLDAGTKRIKNLGNGINSQDAVTMGQLAAAAIAPAGTLAVANGGTGATTAANARTNLGVPGLSGNNNFLGTNYFGANQLQLLAPGTPNQGAGLVMNPAASGTTLAGAFVSDTYQDLWRIYEAGGTFRGAYVDMASLAPNILSRIAVEHQSPQTVRQTVLSGPVDSNGYLSLAGVSGSTGVVTTTGTIRITAANGSRDYTADVTNPGWTGLTTNGTAFLWLEINAQGVITGSGFSMLAPIYQRGGTPSVTNGQHTFNIGEMKMYVGNGTVTANTNRVFIGECTVASAGASITGFIWYALNGQYDSGFTATLPTSTSVSKSSNLGVYAEFAHLVIECTTIDQSYAVGDRIVTPMWTGVASTNSGGIQSVVVNRNTVGFSAFGSYYVPDKLGAVPGASLTASRWKYKLIVSRGW